MTSATAIAPNIPTEVRGEADQGQTPFLRADLAVEWLGELTQRE